MGWTVDVDFRPSGLHGLGVFARRDIPRGARIWEVDAGMRFDDRAAVEALPPAALRDALHGGYLHVPTDRLVWYDDGMQFMNHGPAGQANIGLDHWPALHADHTVALRDIAAGEELLEDYGFWAHSDLARSHWLTALYRRHCPEHLGFLESLHPDLVAA